MTDSPRFVLQGPDREKELTTQAAMLLALAGLSSALNEMEGQLQGGPPETVPAESHEAWRASLQRTLSELRSQILHMGDDDTNTTVISEAFDAAANHAVEIVRHVATTARTQAWVVAAFEQHRIQEAINPTPPAPEPTRSGRIRSTAGNAVWEAGNHAGAMAERIGLLAGKAVRGPLQWLGNAIAGEVE